MEANETKKSYQILNTYIIECQECGRNTFTEAELRNHKKIHETYYFICDNCNKDFAELRYLKRHCKNCVKKKCEKCRIKKTTHKNSYDNDGDTSIIRHHTQNTEHEICNCTYCVCVYCGKKFKEKKDLLEHESNIHVKSCKCPYCSEVFDILPKFKKHLQSHKIEKVTCAHCPKILNRGGIITHYESTHPELKIKLLKCNYCDSLFKFESRFNTHLAYAHNYCIYCEKIFDSALTFKIHKETTHPKKAPKLFQCSYCNKDYKGRSALWKHKKTHTKPDLECAICSKNFFREDGLRRHLKTHFRAKDYTCTVCSAEFARRDNFTEHFSKVHQIDEELKKSLLKCPFCESFYKSNIQLHCHIMNCHNIFENKKKLRNGNKIDFNDNTLNTDIKVLVENTEKDSVLNHVSLLQNYDLIRMKTANINGLRYYQCNVCDILFDRPSKLINHNNIAHSSHRPFECPLCPSRFRICPNLRKHLKQAHNLRSKNTTNNAFMEDLKKYIEAINSNSIINDESQIGLIFNVKGKNLNKKKKVNVEKTESLINESKKRATKGPKETNTNLPKNNSKRITNAIKKPKNIISIKIHTKSLNNRKQTFTDKTTKDMPVDFYDNSENSNLLNTTLSLQTNKLLSSTTEIVDGFSKEKVSDNKNSFTKSKRISEVVKGHKNKVLKNKGKKKSNKIVTKDMPSLDGYNNENFNLVANNLTTHKLLLNTTNPKTVTPDQFLSNIEVIDKLVTEDSLFNTIYLPKAVTTDKLISNTAEVIYELSNENVNDKFDITEQNSVFLFPLDEENNFEMDSILGNMTETISSLKDRIPLELRLSDKNTVEKKLPVTSIVDPISNIEDLVNNTIEESIVNNTVGSSIINIGHNENHTIDVPSLTEEIAAINIIDDNLLMENFVAESIFDPPVVHVVEIYPAGSNVGQVNEVNADFIRNESIVTDKTVEREHNSLVNIEDITNVDESSLITLADLIDSVPKEQLNLDSLADQFDDKYVKSPESNSVEDINCTTINPETKNTINKLTDVICTKNEMLGNNQDFIATNLKTVDANNVLNDDSKQDLEDLELPFNINDITLSLSIDDKLLNYAELEKLVSKDNFTIEDNLTDSMALLSDSINEVIDELSVNCSLDNISLSALDIYSPNFAASTPKHFTNLDTFSSKDFDVIKGIKRNTETVTRKVQKRPKVEDGVNVTDLKNEFEFSTSQKHNREVTTLLNQKKVFRGTEKYDKITLQKKSRETLPKIIEKSKQQPRKRIDLKTYICHKCQKVFKNKSNLNRHIQAGHNRCELCNKTFSEASSRLRHVKRIHGDKTKSEPKYFMCNECGNNFASMSNLTRHRKLGHKVYTCEKCSLKCSSRSHYTKHMRKH